MRVPPLLGGGGRRESGAQGGPGAAQGSASPARAERSPPWRRGAQSASAPVWRLGPRVRVRVRVCTCVHTLPYSRATAYLHCVTRIAALPAQTSLVQGFPFLWSRVFKFSGPGISSSLAESGSARSLVADGFLWPRASRCPGRGLGGRVAHKNGFFWPFLAFVSANVSGRAGGAAGAWGFRGVGCPFCCCKRSPASAVRRARARARPAPRAAAAQAAAGRAAAVPAPARGPPRRGGDAAPPLLRAARAAVE